MTDAQITLARLDIERQCKEDITTGCSSSMLDSAARILAHERATPIVVAGLNAATVELSQQQADARATAVHIAQEVELLAVGIARAVWAGTPTATDALHSRLRDLDRALANVAISSSMIDVCGRLKSCIGQE